MGNIIIIMDLGSGISNIKFYKKANKDNNNFLGLKKVILRYNKRII